MHSSPVQGPVLLPSPRPLAPPGPPPVIPGLQALPAPPKEKQPVLPTTIRQVPPPLETRFVLFAYYDNPKPAITSLWEFSPVEHVMKLFEHTYKYNTNTNTNSWR